MNTPNVLIRTKTNTIISTLSVMKKIQSLDYLEIKEINDESDIEQ